MIVVIVNGKPRVGKTTFAKILSEEKNVVSYSSISLIKEIAEKYSGLEEEIQDKTDNYRVFLAEMKRIFVQHTPAIEKDIHEKYQMAKSAGVDYMLLDIREPSEIEYYKNKYNAVTVYITNNRADGMKWTSSADNFTENYKYDVYIENHGSFEKFKENIQNEFIDRY